MPKWLKIVLSLVALFALIIILLVVIAAIRGQALGDMLWGIMDYLGYIWTDRFLGGGK